MKKLFLLFIFLISIPVFALPEYKLKTINLPNKKVVEKKIADYKGKWNSLSKDEQKKRNKAIKLAEKGNKLYEASKFDEAYKKYQEALSLGADIRETYLGYSAVLLKIKKYDESLNAITKYLEIFSLNAKAYKLLGLTFYKKGELDKALKNYFLSAKIDEKNSNIWTEIANIYYEAKDYTMAAKMYQIAIKKDKNNFKNYLGLGNIFFIGKDYKKALKYFDTGLQYNPKNQELLSEKAQAEAFLMMEDIAKLEKKKKFSQGIEVLKNVIKILPDYEPAYFKIGTFYYKVGSNNLARTNLLHSLELNPENEKTLYFLGLVEYKDKNFDKALDYYEQALVLNDKNSDLYVQIAEIYIQKQSYESALDSLKKATSLGNKSARCLRDMGVAYYETEKYSQAFSIFTKASKLDKKDKSLKVFLKKTKAMLAVKKGNSLFDKKDFKSAKKEYQKAISFDPNFIAAKVSLANTYIELQDMASALKIFEPLYIANTNSGVVIEGLANAYEKDGKIDESKKMYKKLENLKGYDPLIYYNLGLNYELKNQFDKAIDSYNSALKIKKDFSKALHRLGFVYYKKGIIAYNNSQFQTAISNLNTALKFDSNNLDIINKINYIRAFQNIDLALKAYKSGLYDKGIQFYKDAEKFDDSIPEIYFGLGQIYFEKGNWEAADTNLQKAIELKNDFLEAYKLLSDVKRYKKEYAQASLTLNKALALSPNDASLYTKSGYIFYLNNDLENAKKMYLRAVSMESNDPDVHVNLGLVYFKEGNYATAEQEFVTANRLRANMDDVYFDLGLVYYKENKFFLSQRHFMKSIALRDDVPAKFFYLARSLYYIKGFLDDAIFNTKKAISMRDSVKYYYGLGKMYEKKMTLVRLSDVEKYRTLAIEAYRTVVKRASGTQVGKWSEDRLKVLLQTVRLVSLYSALDKTSESFALDGESVYVGDKSGKFYEFNPSATNNEHLVWSYQTSLPVEKGPVLTNGKIFFANQTSLFVFDKDSKSLLWQKNMGAVITSSISVNQNTAFFTADDGYLYGLQNGRVVFKNNIGTSAVQPVFSNDKVIQVNTDGEILVYGINDQKLAWSFQASDTIKSKPLFWDNKIIVTSVDGRIYALDSVKGNVIWEFQTDGQISVSGLIENNILYYPSGSMVYGLTSEGKLSVLFPVYAQITSDLGVNTQNHLFVGDSNGTISCFDLNTKHSLWTYHTEKKPVGSPILIADTIGYFNTDDGSIYKLEFLR